MELRYEKSGDYYIPNLALPEGNYTIGKYSRLRRDSGSSVHSGRAGSSPASRTIQKALNRKI